MMPATSALLVNNYRGKDRALAFAIWGAVAASAAAIGPILGGYLTAHYSWRLHSNPNRTTKPLTSAPVFASSVVS